ncbi:MAG: hypothetical protein M0C28_05170 [Candidatus Moduliflexus flocculans]|nr:hypothetical protein [Candidatus Moduliflexus flocculans]
MALWEAAEADTPSPAKALLAGGANANDGGRAKDKRFDYGETMRDGKAVDRGDVEMVSALGDAGRRDVNRENQYRIASHDRRPVTGGSRIVHILVKAGANVNAADTAGTPVPVWRRPGEPHRRRQVSSLASGAKAGQKKRLLLDAAKTTEMKKLIQWSKVRTT